MTMTFSPTKRQRDFYDWIVNGSGHGMLDALAGAGKTTTIQNAVEYCLKTNPNARVFYLCFNVKIKEELRARGLNANNYHGWGYYLLTKKFGKFTVNASRGRNIALSVLGYDGEPNSAPDGLYEEAANLAKLTSLAKGYDIDYKSTKDDGRVEDLIHRFDLFSPGQDENGKGGYSVRALVRFTKQCMKVASNWTGIIDQDDMVWIPVSQGMVFPLFDFVFVDEFQDSNPIQVSLAKGLVKRGTGRLVFVGDPNQAIYEWRGAEANVMDNAARALNCTRLPLDECFRCCKSVVREAQALVPNIRHVESAPEGKVESISLLDTMFAEIRVGDFIVSRTRAPMFSLALSLLSRNIRARIKGQDIAQGLLAMVRKSKKAQVGAFLQWLKGWATKEELKITKRTKDKEERASKVSRIQDTVKVFETLCATSGVPTCDSLSDKIRELCEVDPTNGKGQFVEIMTTHGAKGLESDTVWLLRDTYRPGATPEESRLLYVAVTRAKTRLVKVLGVK